VSVTLELSKWRLLPPAEVFVSPIQLQWRGKHRLDHMPNAASIARAPGSAPWRILRNLTIYSASKRSISDMPNIIVIDFKFVYLTSTLYTNWMFAIQNLPGYCQL
jgi:hypothetical protein